jgi:hypothetical protein
VIQSITKHVIQDVLSDPLSQFGKFFTAQWGSLANFAGTMWRGIGVVGRVELQRLEAFARSDVSAIRQYFQALWNDVVSIYVDGVRKANAAVDQLRGLPGHVLGGAGAAVGGFVGGGVGGAVGGSIKAMMVRAVAERDRLVRDITGLKPFQAAGIVSNLAAESGVTGTNEKHPLIPGSRGGVNLEQWTGPRRRAFEAWAGAHNLSPFSPEAGHGYLVYELQHNQALLARIKAAKTAQEAAMVFFGEVSGGAPFLQHLMPKHVAYADRIAAAEASGSAGGSVEVNVNVRHNGAQATVRTAATGNVRAHGRVESSLNAVPA